MRPPTLGLQAKSRSAPIRLTVWFFCLFQNLAVGGPEQRELEPTAELVTSSGRTEHIRQEFGKPALIRDADASDQILKSRVHVQRLESLVDFEVNQFVIAR